MDSSAQDIVKPNLAGIEELKIKISQAKLPSEVLDKLDNLLNFPVSGAEFSSLVAYVDFVLSLPFAKISQDILDINRAKQILDKNHYGLVVVKDRILEYLSILILHKQKADSGSFHAPILAFIGLVGTGKTSLAYSIAEALGRPIIRIPFGGLGDPESLRGQSRLKPNAEPGQIIKAIKIAKVSNPVILLDEIDRVDQQHRVDIMGVLVELLDPAQNQSFVDHYLDFPYDLSQVLFIVTANNTGNIATAVMDRLEPIQMPSYSDEEKTTIGKNYLLPRAIDEAGIDSNLLKIDESLWPNIIRPLGFDAGIRSLSRGIQTICRKVAKKVVQGEQGPFTINAQNLEEYLNE
ncbi:AAA family ATPase [Candidatus Daviesbacteria bacterium]|nr:AAA family ATPase [Candidatus Daviesbacteria bacterium]